MDVKKVVIMAEDWAFNAYELHFDTKRESKKAKWKRWLDKFNLFMFLSDPMVPHIIPYCIDVCNNIAVEESVHCNLIYTPILASVDEQLEDVSKLQQFYQSILLFDAEFDSTKRKIEQAMELIMGYIPHFNGVTISIKSLI